jgi:stress response protein YsnF
LYEELLEQNNSLKIFNEQIAQRMQERDEELHFAYLELDEQEKTIEQLKARVSVWIKRTLIIGGVFLLFLLIKYGLPFAMRLARGF